MNDEISRLRKKINELEEILEDKDILINALLKDIKRRKTNENEDLIINKQEDTCKPQDDTFKLQDFKNPSQDSVLNKIQNSNLSQEIIADELIPNKIEKSFIKNEIQKENIKSDLPWSYKFRLKEDLETFFGRKKIVRVFKENSYFDEFIDFCTETYTQKSFEIQKISHSKNVKKYLQENKNKILKYLILNINKLSFSNVCSTLLVLSTEFTDTEKFVIIHDIILYVQDFSKLIFYSFCILNNQITDSGVFYSTIHSILSYQYLVDLEIHKSKKIIGTSLTYIKNLLSFKCTKPLEEVLSGIKVDIPVFSKYKFNTDIYQYIYSLRSLCHFLDWDYVYNTFILEELSKNLTGCKILYMGILALNSIRLFGSTESSDTIMDFIKDKMKNIDEIGLASYLIIKQINEKDSQEYLETNEEALSSSGHDITYLRTLLIY
ncbi:uncharacterized protein VNE69_03051 [Vairimorpha necatrix]|uniref:Uncharacterized protein n=1 Tax=Vairimorpha necatrix TaxID=6039 RepID=A0AAX4JA68_9MICR